MSERGERDFYWAPHYCQYPKSGYGWESLQHRWNHSVADSWSESVSAQSQWGAVWLAMPRWTSAARFMLAQPTCCAWLTGQHFRPTWAEASTLTVASPAAFGFLGSTSGAHHHPRSTSRALRGKPCRWWGAISRSSEESLSPRAGGSTWPVWHRQERSGLALWMWRRISSGAGLFCAPRLAEALAGCAPRCARQRRRGCPPPEWPLAGRWLEHVCG